MPPRPTLRAARRIVAPAPTPGRRRPIGARLRPAACAAALALAAACGADATAPTPTAGTAPVQRWPVASRLPVLRVATADAAPVASRDVYVPATYTLTDTLGAVRATGAADVRGRGNSTWDMPKKPYRLRLGSGTALLGMPANRHWVLLANYSDKTLFRNAVAFAFSRLLGMAYTPRAEFVELELNGDAVGIYQLTEAIRLGPDRVNVPELKAGDTTAAAITGGYLLEVDERRGEAFCFQTGRTSMVFCAKSPETLLEPERAPQRAYIEGYLRDLDAALYGPAFADPTVGYAAWLDVPSTVDHYLLQELVKNVDGNLRLSTYLVKPRGGKLAFGPVWDFDLAMGNVNYDGADRIDGWHARRGAWFARLFEDPAFDARVRARWRQLRADGTIDRVLTEVAVQQAYLGVVQAGNFRRWPILSTWVWPNRVVTGSYGGEVQALDEWLRARIAWLDGQLGR